MSKNDQLDWGHPVVEQAITLPGVQRRRLIQLAVTALALAPGCALLNPQTEFEAAVDDLSQELKAVADNEAQDDQLQTLATRLVEQAQVLSRSHSRFTRNFKRDLADASVDAEELLANIDAYDKQYQADLVALLTLQDQLHQALQPEEWRQVAAALNQTAVRLDNRIMGTN